MLYPGITQEVAPDESQRGPKPKTSADGDESGSMLSAAQR